jgi:DNA-binding LytR/AlgR family response regulator
MKFERGMDDRGHYFVGDTAKGFIVHPEDVIRLESDQNYTRVLLADGKIIMIRRPVYVCAEKLGKDFFEAHRGRWVNLTAVKEVRVHVDSKRYVFLFGPGIEPIVLSRHASLKLKAMRL